MIHLDANKHQISLYLGLKKMANILQITFGNGFSFKKKLLSVFLPVTPFSLCSHHGIIMKFSGVITNNRSDVYAKVQGQGSKVKVTEVKIQTSRFRTITPIWFHIWWWNDEQSLILFRSSALLIFKVICQISRSRGEKNHWFRPNLSISGLYFQFEFTDGYEMMHKVWSSIEEVPCCFSRLSVKFQGHRA